MCFCTPGEIPDAAFIHAARKRRQMARELGGDAPLVEAQTPQKRLAQEDQDASDDDEDEKRIRFSGVRNKTQRQKIAEEIGEWLKPRSAARWPASDCSQPVVFHRDRGQR